MIKKTIRLILDSLIFASSPLIWRSRKGLLILTYHRVLPRSYPELDIVEPGMMVHDDTFEMHLRYLKKHFEMVDLSDWLAKRAAGSALPKRACAITFDDGWRDNYLYAYPLLKKHNVPATIFVVSNLVGTDTQFWPERLARALRHRQKKTAELTAPWMDALLSRSDVSIDDLDRETISRVIKVAKSETDENIHSNLEDVEEIEGKPSRFGKDLIAWEEAGDMVDSGLITLGSHTRNHVRLNEHISIKKMEDELIGSKLDIQNKTGRMVSLFCYPNGDSCTEAEKIIKTNYMGACTTTHGWNDLDANALYLRRINIHEDRTCARQGFVSSITGWA